MGKGGGGGGQSAPAPAPSTQTVTNTSIPAYAQPYVETMLGQSQALTDINQNPYQTYGGQRIAEFSPLQQQAFANVASQTTSPQLDTATNYAQQSGGGQLGTTNTANYYGGLGAGYGGAAAGLAPQAQGYGQTAADIGMGGLGYGAMGARIGQQAGRAGEQYAREATSPAAMQAYMNPYVQASLQPQLNLLAQQGGIQSAAQQSAATQAGAFGGSRSALANALVQQNNLLAQQQAIGQGYNQAYQQAQQAQQFGANLGLQGKQTALQGAQLGLSGLGTAMQGQQAGLQGLQQAGSLYGQGMAGAQVGLQGVGAQQAGYAGANQAASTLGQLGQTQFAQQQAINQAQQTTGAVQQAQAQQALDQQYQDFLKQKNYPYQQLAFMSDMLRGLPLSQSAQTQYTAPPNMASQLGGLGMSALGIYGMSGGFKAKGGMVGEGYAKGGLMAAKAYKEGGYADGGGIDTLNVKQLMEMLDNPTLTPSEVDAIERRIILLRRMENNPQTQEIMAPATQRAGIGAIATGDMVPEEGMAGGGIVAFAQGGSSNKDNYQSWLEGKVRESIENQLGSNAFERSEGEKAKLEQAIAARSERAPWEALAMAGLGTMAGTSQYGLSNLGQGGLEGLRSYSKALGQESSDRQKLLEQQVYADKAEDARKSALTGQMQTTLGHMYSRDAARAAASANAIDPDIKAMQKAQMLINQDDQLPLLYKQRDMYDPGDPKYTAYNNAINSIKRTYYEQVGIKRPYIAPAAVQFPEEKPESHWYDFLTGGSKTETKNKVVPYGSLPTK